MTRPSCPTGQSPGREGSVAGVGWKVGGGGEPAAVPQAALTPQLTHSASPPSGVRVHSLWEVALRPGRPQSRV